MKCAAACRKTGVVLLDEIGEIIRRARKERKMTLKQLAEETGLSVSFLSEVERGVANVSVAALARVARALKLETIGLAESGREADTGKEKRKEEVTLVKKDRRIRILQPGYDAVPELLTSDLGQRIDAMYVKLKPGFESGPDPFAAVKGEKLLYMLEGEAAMTVCGRTYELSKGDSIYYPASSPIRFQNTRDTDAEVLVVLVSR